MEEQTNLLGKHFCVFKTDLNNINYNLREVQNTTKEKIGMVSKIEKMWDNLKLFMLYNLARFLSTETIIKIEALNGDVFVKIIDRTEEAGLYVVYEYLPKYQKVRMTTTYKEEFDVDYVEIKGLFTENKFKNIIREHSNKMVEKFNITGISSGKYLDINPEKAIF